MVYCFVAGGWGSGVGGWGGGGGAVGVTGERSKNKICRGVRHKTDRLMLRVLRVGGRGGGTGWWGGGGG